MNDNERKDLKSKSGGWKTAPEYTSQSGFESSWLVTLGLILAESIVAVAIQRVKAGPVETDIRHS